MVRERLLLSPALRDWRTGLERLFDAKCVPDWMPSSLPRYDRVLCTETSDDLAWARTAAGKRSVTIIEPGPIDYVTADQTGMPPSIWCLETDADALANGHPQSAATKTALYRRSLFRSVRSAKTQPPDIYAFLRDCDLNENDRPAYCVGVKFWNHKSVAALVGGSKGKAVFTDDFDAAFAGAKESGGRLIAWSASATDERERACRDAGIPFYRMEDGFLRSVGLGAALSRGASAAFDQSGIYFDATRPSDLETMLETVDLADGEIARARSLREAIIAARLTKYNVGRRFEESSFPENQAKILVPGQVADDAGILKTLSKTVDCTGTTNVNESLLKAVRDRNPDAFIIYKPHPDVDADLRKGRVDEDTAHRYADTIVRDIDILDLIDQCDRIETVSSLTGFEALMRGKHVTVHGMPFYAGWGLTEDLTQCHRRTRQRSVDELVHFAMIAYCRYIDPDTLIPCRPEHLIGNLTRQRQSKTHNLKYTAIKFVSWFGRKIGL